MWKNSPPPYLVPLFSLPERGSVDLDESTAALTAVFDRAGVFRRDLLKIPAPFAVNLPALGAITFPQLLLPDGQVAVAAPELLPLLLQKHKFLVSARCHGQENTGLKFETQPTSLHAKPTFSTPGFAMGCVHHILRKGLRRLNSGRFCSRDYIDNTNEFRYIST